MRASKEIKRAVIKNRKYIERKKASLPAASRQQLAVLVNLVRLAF
jgi:hypothetical protein